MRETRQQEWVNWSGSLRFTPDLTAEPESEDELAGLVRRAAAEGRTVRPVGMGHSSTPLMQTEDVLVSLEKITGLVSYDTEGQEATLKAGTMLHDAGRALHEVGLALWNYGDVDFQTLGGVVGTGTHGAGIKLGSFSNTVIGARMISAAGDVVEIDEDDLDLLRAARVSLLPGPYERLNIFPTGVATVPLASMSKQFATYSPSEPPSERFRAGARCTLWSGVKLFVRN